MSLSQILQARIKGKTLIVGIGNPLRGDDGLGPKLIENLQGQIQAALLDAGETPESYLERILAEQPATVVVVDVVAMGASPGSAAIIELNELTSLSYSTHKLSLQLFMRYIQEQSQADLFVLGIQPETLEFGEPMSPLVRDTLQSLTDCLKRILPVAQSK